jgi:17beta-estradiol 17-dehydrogenase / very-long-chain 3-oxoacyl-CoA reductase
LVEAFASKGFNVVLVSRTQAKLEAVAKELDKYKVETRVIAVDANAIDVVRSNSPH